MATEVPGSCTDHARQRMLERYGIVLDWHIEQRIHRLIQGGRAHLVKEQPGEAATYLVRIGGQRIGVVYWFGRNEIATILPPTDLRVARA